MNLLVAQLIGAAVGFFTLPSLLALLECATHDGRGETFEERYQNGLIFLASPFVGTAIGMIVAPYFLL